MSPILNSMMDEQEKDGTIWTPSTMIARLGKEVCCEPTHRETDVETNVHADGQTGGRAGGRAGGPAASQPARPTDRPTDRNGHIRERMLAHTTIAAVAVVRHHHHHHPRSTTRTAFTTGLGRITSPCIAQPSPTVLWAT